MTPFEIRLVVRVLAIVAAGLTVASLIFNNLLYIPGLLVGAATVLIYRRTKPGDITPYFYLALIATIAAFVVFIVQGVLGFVFFINS